MKLWRVWSVFGLGAVAASAVVQTAGCGTTSSGADSGANVGQPPPVPTGTLTQPSTNIETFAIQTLFLGEADRATPTVVSSSAWKSYGYNLDGKVTTKDSTDVCTLAAGASKTNQVDGNNGIDNAFGSVILPILQSAISNNTPSSTISGYIDKGNFTIQLQITGLDDTPTQNSTGLAGQLFASGAYDNGTPTFDKTTDWPVNPQLLNDFNQQTQSCPTGGCLVSSGSTINFAKGYINNGTFVSGDLSAGGITVSLSLVFQGVPLTLSVNHAVITFDHTTANAATNGTIAGVINTTQLINGLKSVAGRISPSLCGPAFTGIAQQLMQASDIIQDGTNKSGVPCDGIAIGLGFTAALVANPTKVSVSDGGVPPDPCATDGGTTDSGNDTGSSDTGTGG